jgi:transketolase
MEKESLDKLKERARRIRLQTVKSLGEAGSGHPGGSLSLVDILTVLYFQVMRIDPKDPSWEDRDRFVLSKGHAAPALYATLAEAGFFPEEELLTLRKFGSRLQGHPDRKRTPGVEMSTGSLGQGLSVANGIALAGKLDGKDYRVYVALGDGECEEGQVWEAAMTSVHRKLDNLTAFVDNNTLQIDGNVEDIKSLRNIGARFQAFGWNVIEIDGHNMREIAAAIELAKATKGKPTKIIAHTIKGKGVSYMENALDWHGAAPNAELTQKAIRELEGDVRG